MDVDHVLLVGFGGPTHPDEIQPFLEQVTRGHRLPAARLEDVAHHYHRVGGRSRYNEYTLALAQQLAQCLQQAEIHRPVFVGLRNWHPFLEDTLRHIHAQGLRRGLGVILAPHRCDSSYERYLRDVDQARQRAGAQAITYRYLASWHDHPLFIRAQADAVADTLDRVPARAQAHLLFTAHAIPTDMAGAAVYVEQVADSSQAVARRLGWSSWSVAYQSRSGDPRQPWLEPEVSAAIQTLAQRQCPQVVIVPIGFFCDNVEVVYDLDVEAQAAAAAAGVGYSRAPTVAGQAAFTQMFAQMIGETLSGVLRRCSRRVS